MKSKMFDSNPTVYGVIAKIADFYGMDSARELLRRLGLEIPRTPMAYDYRLLTRVMNDDVIKADVPKFLSDLPVAELSENKRSSTDDYMSKFFRVCKVCLLEGNLHQDIWQKAFYTHCVIHSVRLSEACEHTYANADWAADVLCKKCEPAASAAEIPPFLQYWCSLKTEQECSAFTSSLYFLAGRMVRPFDYIVAGLSWEKLSLKDVESILSDAFEVGSNLNAYSIWSNEILNLRKKLITLGDSTPKHLLSELDELLANCAWPGPKEIGDVKSVLHRYHNNVEKHKYSTRYHIFDSDSGDDVSLRISSAMVSRILDIEAEALPELVDENILPIKKRAARSDKLIFDAHDVAQAIYDIFDTPIQQISNTVSIRGVGQKVLNALLLTPKLITKHLLHRRLKGFWAVDSTLSLINKTTLCKQSLKEILDYELSHSDHLSITKTARFLGIRTPGVQLLVSRGLLSWARWQRTCGEMIDIDSIRDFMREYVCIDREAILKGVKKDDFLADVSGCCGILPNIHEKAFKDSLTIAVYKKASLNPCCLTKAMNGLEVLSHTGLDLSKKVRRYSNVA
jgi:hypothetical protein